MHRSNGGKFGIRAYAESDINTHAELTSNPQYRWGTPTPGEGSADGPAMRGPQPHGRPQRRR